MLYSHTTRSLTVSVIPAFQEDQSDPKEEHYVWACNIRIDNNGDKPVQIISRKWRVIDALGQVEDITSPGVIGPSVQGAQPVIGVGESLEYTSEAHLVTSSGIMIGSYQVRFGDEEETVEVMVPSFSLDMPGLPVRLH